jgi:hypothetical protein
VATSKSKAAPKTSKKKSAPIPVDAEAEEQPEEKRPDFPTAITINYAKDGFGGSGFVISTDISLDPEHPNIIWLHDALLPDRRTGKYVNSYIYIIPTRELVTVVTDGNKLTWEEVDAR